jgi:hypothetical protein
MTETEFIAEFNAAAKRFRDSPDTIDMLLTKFAALRDFKLEDQAGKERLAAALFDCCEENLKARIGPKPRWFNAESLGPVTKLLDAAAEPETARLLPRRAPGALADYALELTRLEEKLSQSEYDGDYRSHLAHLNGLQKLAPLVLACAQKVKKIGDALVPAVDKPVVLGRPMVFKKPDAQD